MRTVSHPTIHMTVSGIKSMHLDNKADGSQNWLLSCQQADCISCSTSGHCRWNCKHFISTV